LGNIDRSTELYFVLMRARNPMVVGNRVDDDSAGLYQAPTFAEDRSKSRRCSIMLLEKIGSMD
jgi:hypothetical protein